MIANFTIEMKKKISEKKFKFKMDVRKGQSHEK